MKLLEKIKTFLVTRKQRVIGIATLAFVSGFISVKASPIAGFVVLLTPVVLYLATEGNIQKKFFRLIKYFLLFTTVFGIGSIIGESILLSKSEKIQLVKEERIEKLNREKRELREKKQAILEKENKKIREISGEKEGLDYDKPDFSFTNNTLWGRTFNAQKLLNEYDDNLFVAKQKYYGKLVRIKDYLVDISTYNKDKVLLIIDSNLDDYIWEIGPDLMPNMNGTVTCIIDQRNPDLLSLTKGKQVVITGLVEKYNEFFGNVRLTNCRINNFNYPRN